MTSTVAIAGTQALIRLDAVSKSFQVDGGRYQAVKRVTLAIQRGDIYGLIGKSGAGKSTLLRLINLLERPEEGTVHVDGVALTSLAKRDLRQAR